MLLSSISTFFCVISLSYLAVLEAARDHNAVCFVVDLDTLLEQWFPCSFVCFCLLLRTKKPGEDYRKQLLLTAINQKRKQLPDPQTCLLFLYPCSLFLLANLWCILNDYRMAQRVRSIVHSLYSCIVAGNLLCQVFRSLICPIFLPKLLFA